MPARAATLLNLLERTKTVYGEETTPQKSTLLADLALCRLKTADEIERLHQCLCFLLAYPDNPEIHSQVDTMLAGFAERPDLRRFRKQLANSGIAGTDTYYAFYWPTALWLARHCPDNLTIDWTEFENQDKLLDLLGCLLPYSEAPGLDVRDFPLREWLDRLKAPTETDAAFVINRFAAMKVDSFTREKLYEEIDIPMKLSPGPATPSITTEALPGFPVACRNEPLSRKRPQLRREIRKPIQRVRLLDRNEGRRFVDAAVAAMITRSRDLDAFAYGDANDVRLVHCEGDLEFVFIGQIPERRLLIETVYGFLALKNGVPIGYGTTSVLFDSAEIAFNAFAAFRGAETALTFARLLATTMHLFGADAFSLDPYQLGHDNAEGLRSGAWWFYYKLGFRPEDSDVRQVLRLELQRQKQNRRHRSNLATLQRLSSENMYFYLNKKRPDVLAKLSLSDLSLRISNLLAERCGAKREQGIHQISQEAGELLGIGSQRKWTRGEMLAWQRWSPLIVLLPNIKRWSDANKRKLVRVVRAKGGQRESSFVTHFNQHRLLRQAVLKLIEQ